MGVNRRLQTEIDRCLKRVTDGQHEFQELWLKLEAMETVSAPCWPYPISHAPPYAAAGVPNGKTLQIRSH